MNETKFAFFARTRNVFFSSLKGDGAPLLVDFEEKRNVFKVDLVAMRAAAGEFVRVVIGHQSVTEGARAVVQSLVAEGRGRERASHVLTHLRIGQGAISHVSE